MPYCHLTRPLRTACTCRPCYITTTILTTSSHLTSHVSACLSALSLYTTLRSALFLSPTHPSTPTLEAPRILMLSHLNTLMRHVLQIEYLFLELFEKQEAVAWLLGWLPQMQGMGREEREEVLRWWYWKGVGEKGVPSLAWVLLEEVDVERVFRVALAKR